MTKKSEHQIDFLVVGIWCTRMEILMENLLDSKLALVIAVISINATQCPEYVTLTEDISSTKTPKEANQGGLLQANMFEFQKLIAKSYFRPKLSRTHILRVSKK